MKNKENALNKIEQIEGAVNNVKASAMRGFTNELPEKFERLETLIEELKSLISVEQEEFLNRRYSGL